MTETHCLLIDPLTRGHSGFELQVQLMFVISINLIAALQARKLHRGPVGLVVSGVNREHQTSSPMGVLFIDK